MEWLRCLFVEAVERNVARIAQHPPCKMREPNLALASTEMRDLAELVKANGHARMNALLEDLQGQCLEALSRLDWYNRWGCHYMPSIMFAHAVQQCNNFKDPSVQVYGGKMFVDIQTMADEKFDALPPPTPRDLSSFSRRRIWLGVRGPALLQRSDRKGVVKRFASIGEVASFGDLDHSFRRTFERARNPREVRAPWVLGSAPSCRRADFAEERHISCQAWSLS